MRSNPKCRADTASSRQKMKALYRQEEEVSRAFQLTEFYDQSQHLNLQELKKRLQSFKKQQMTPTNSKHSQYKPFEYSGNTFKGQQTAKFSKGISRKQTPNTRPRNHQKSYQQTLNNLTSEESTYRKHNDTIKSQHWISKKPQVETPAFRARTQYRSNLPKAAVISTLFALNRRSKKMRTSLGKKSKCSDSSLQHSFQQANFENTIKIVNKGEISELENRIQNLWAHYQLVTKIMVGLRDGTQHQQKNSIVNYIHTVCSNRFQFLKEVLSTVSRSASSRGEAHTAKRLNRVVILSRVYENIGIVYVSLYLCLGIKVDSHLINLIGYATSSLAFSIRLIEALHSLEAPLTLSKTTSDILETIGEFEKGTYGGKIGKVNDVILRLEQNNEVMSIVQNKMCHQMNSQFQQTIGNLLKNVDLDSKGLFEYATYLFEFLSFHLASVGSRGYFPAVQLPPAPYLSQLPKPRTLVIEPWGVLFARKGANTFVRAHTELFLSQVEKHWNIVYWSDLMPKDVDDLLERLPKGNWLYRYHCIQSPQGCRKPLERLGTPLTNTLLIDRSEFNISKKHSSMVLKMPWKAQKRDLRLLHLLDLLKPIFFDDQTPLCELVQGVRSKISGAIKRKANRKQDYSEDEGFPQRLRVSK